MATTTKTRKKPAKGKTPQSIEGKLNLIFGPVADPAPDSIGGHGWPWPWPWPHWPGPGPDPVPAFRSLLDRADRKALPDAAVRQLGSLRSRQIDATIQYLEAHAAIAKEEWDVLARQPEEVQRAAIAGLRPPWWPGDPVPEIKPIDLLKYLHDLRSQGLDQTIALLKQAAAAIKRG
jgi:hypothetical protein